MRKLLDRLALLACAVLIVASLAWVVFHPSFVAGIQLILAALLISRRWAPRSRVEPFRCACADPIHRAHRVGDCPHNATESGYCRECEAFAQSYASRLIDVLRRTADARR